jgi:ATP-dependent exoDNAse (exonuclease V) beta subunit
LIPFDLRKKHNLTTIIENDARTSYDFYHLLLRATNIHLIYNSVSEGVDTGEKSRFIHQLELIESPNHNIQHIISHYPFNPSDNEPEKFEKTDTLITRLNQIAESGFSPSSLNRYIDNPINFFDEYVVGIKSSEKVNEFPEARGIGIIFHNVMEKIYKPFEGKKIDPKKLKISLNSIDKLLDHEFINEYGKKYERGKNIIIYKVLKDTIKRLIKVDINKISKGIELKIIDIESKLEIDLVTEKSKIKYKLKGTVDRIQSENGNIKIIDYKTGSFEPYKLSFKNYQDLIDKKKKEAFQLLCYCMMYSRSNKKTQNLNAGIISFKNINLGLITLKKSKTENYNNIELDNFKLILDNIIEEIFDPNISFSEN